MIQVISFRYFHKRVFLMTPIHHHFELKGWSETTIIVRFAPIDGSSDYGFDPTAEPGYVWHCHIIDHEDNEMMRPYRLIEEIEES